MITRPSFGLCEEFTDTTECGPPVCNCGITKKIIAIVIAIPAPMTAPRIFLFNNIDKRC